MRAKRINITIPEKNLKEIDQFCIEEGMSKSQLIREAAVKYIADVKEQKEIEKRKREIESAIEMMDELRKKKITFKDGKTAEEVIREFRDSR